MEFTREELAEVGVDINDLHEITSILHEHIKWQGDEIRLVDNTIRETAADVDTGTETLARVVTTKRKETTVLAVIIPVVVGAAIGGPVGGVIGMSVAAGAIGVGLGGVAGLGIGIGVKKIMERIHQ